MLKKLALPVVALAAMLTMASAPAKAAVHFGISVGAPVYTYPAPVYPAPYAAPYVDPYVDPYAVAPDYYYAPAPVYTYPSVGLGFRFGGGHERYDYGRSYRGFDNHSRGFSNSFRGSSHGNGGHRR